MSASSPPAPTRHAAYNFFERVPYWLLAALFLGVIMAWRIVTDESYATIFTAVAKGVGVTENDQAMDAIAEVGPGGHYLGCAHTQANFKTAFWRTGLLDYKPFETWEEEGARDTQALAAIKVRQLLDSYQKPAMDPAVEEALKAFVAERKASMPDAFI